MIQVRGKRRGTTTGVGGRENKENSEPGRRWAGGGECKGTKGAARGAAKEDRGETGLKMGVRENFCHREREVPGKALRNDMGHWIKQTIGQVHSQKATSLFRRAERLSGDGAQLTVGGTQKTQNFKLGMKVTFTTMS